MGSILSWKGGAGMQAAFENGTLTLHLTGHVDPVNASRLETEIRQAREQYPAQVIVLDCDDLKRMSSAGLRVILRLKQEVPDTSLVNVHPGFYELLVAVGFSEMMEVRKVYRVVSLAGCELIAQGANGKVFRYDQETIVKVYTNTDALPLIEHERELSRAAFVLGVPTAIPYDVVQIAEGGYGTVYEMLNARTYLQLYRDGEKSLEELADMSIMLLKFVHSHIVTQCFVPSIKETALGWVRFLKDYLEKTQYEKLYALVGGVPDDEHLIHGDYHLRNLMYQNGESLLIDMDKLSHGHPIFELSAMYNAYVGFGAADPSVVERFFGLPYEQSTALWRRLLEGYLETEDAQRLAAVEEKVKIISCARLMRHVIHYGGGDSEADKRQIAWCRAELEKLLPRTDTLLF